MSLLQHRLSHSHPPPIDYPDLPTGDKRKKWENQLTADIAGILSVEQSRVTVAAVAQGPSVHSESRQPYSDRYGGNATVIVTVHVAGDTQKKGNSKGLSVKQEDDEDSRGAREGAVHLLSRVMLAQLEDRQGLSIQLFLL